MFNSKGRLVDRGESGTCFGSTTLAGGNPSRFDVTAIEDCLTLVLAADDFHRLSADHPAFARFFDAQRASRMSEAVAALQLSETGTAILKTRVRDMVRADPVIVGVGDSIRHTASAMAVASASAALVVAPDGAIAGIVTDRDLRNRVVAAGVPTESPVREIMSPDPVTGSADSLAFEVMLEMVDRNIHHMPVMAAGAPIGVVTTTDLVRLEHANPIFITRDIARQQDVAGVAEVSSRLPGVVETLVRQDASARDMGRIVTAVGDAVDRRLLALAEERLGPPPVPYCWIVLGSRARREQGLSADQDNALVLDDGYLPEHESYFAELARLVTDGLATCGYARCPGDVMATNPKWRAPVAVWRRAFEDWMTRPVPRAVLQASIFFDMRPVFGHHDLVTTLADYVCRVAPDAKLFLGHLARAAVSNEPPLGFFRHLVVAKAGDHKDRFDIKRGGVQAVVELARVQALAIGSAEVNTTSRLQALIDAGVMDSARGLDLIDAFEFISYLRLRHQARLVQAGREPDDYVSPLDLTSLDKSHLRDAFAMISRAQHALSQRYSVAFMR